MIHLPFFFFNDTATTEIYTLSLHDALPISVVSEANFVFVPVGPDAKDVSEELLRLGVIVRPLGWMGLPEAIRISVGAAEENGKCLTALRQVQIGRAHV